MYIAKMYNNYYNKYEIRRKELMSMDINVISQFIGSVGFPIVACVMLYKMINETMQKNTDAINKLSDAMTDFKTTMEHVLIMLNDKDKEE